MSITMATVETSKLRGIRFSPTVSLTLTSVFFSVRCVYATSWHWHLETNSWTRLERSTTSQTGPLWLATKHARHLYPSKKKKKKKNCTGPKIEIKWTQWAINKMVGNEHTPGVNHHEVFTVGTSLIVPDSGMQYSAVVLVSCFAIAACCSCTGPVW